VTALAPPAAKTTRRRNWVGYALLAPGGLWLVVFFVVPTVTLVVTSLYDPTGSLTDGYALTGRVANYTDVIREYSDTLLRPPGDALAATSE